MTDETGVVESPQDEQVNVEDASDADLRSLLGTERVEVDTPEAPETEQTEETEFVPEEPAPEEQIPEETEAERLAKRRIRPKSALDQQVLDLYKSEAFDGSFADASRVIYGQEAQQTQNLSPAREAADTTSGVVDQYNERVLNLHQEIKALEGQVDEAAENMETADALRLQRAITRRELEVQKLNSQKESFIQRRRDEEYNTHRTKALESRDRAMEAIPDLQDKDSLIRKQFDEYVRQAQDDPDYAAVFQSPLWPEIMTREFTSVLHQAHMQQEQQAPPQQAPVMGNQAKVLTTGTTAQPANAPITAEQVASNMSQMSNDQLYALLGRDDGRRAPLR